MKKDKIQLQQFTERAAKHLTSTMLASVSQTHIRTRDPGGGGVSCVSDTPQHNPDWTTWTGIWVKGQLLCSGQRGRESEGEKLEIDYY